MMFNPVYLSVIPVVDINERYVNVKGISDLTLCSAL